MTLRRVVGWSGELLVTLGVLVLLFAAWQLWWTDVVADRAQARIVASLEEEFAESAREPVARSTTAPADGIPEPVGPDGAFAVVRIPRFGADYARPVLEGTGRDVLALGVGHYVGTAGPGQVGNFALAGHRTTYGRPFHDVDRLVDGDPVVVETAAEVHVYEVTSREVVRPGDVDVVAPVPSEPGAPPTEALITLTSCHPRYSATERFVVHGRLVESVPRSAWDPARLLALTGA
ncbi:class E sortase [Fodinibacter luteus]|uniref:Class E sortase n=1 Tax=Fodinibacter luteus TaxID=552064 RepID=A0ABP8KE60_9MICO